MPKAEALFRSIRMANWSGLLTTEFSRQGRLRIRESWMMVRFGRSSFTFVISNLRVGWESQPCAAAKG